MTIVLGLFLWVKNSNNKDNDALEPISIFQNVGEPEEYALYKQNSQFQEVAIFSVGKPNSVSFTETRHTKLDKTVCILKIMEKNLWIFFFVIRKKN